MKALMLLLLSAVGFTADCFGVVLYTNSFDNASSLNGFTIGQIGSGTVTLSGGQLQLNPGSGYLNRCYAARPLSSIPGYKTTLKSNPGTLIWAFNVSNSNGATNQNNLFHFGIYSSADASDPAGFGYKIGAGGYVGDFMELYRGAAASSPSGPVKQSIVSVAKGLSVLPKVGAVKITYNPVTGTWSLYFEQHDTPVDPLSITTLVGTGFNPGFESNSLPYVFFESENYGNVYIDNFSMSALPIIRIATISPEKVRVSWPTNYFGYVLQSTLNPTASGWTTVTNVPVSSSNTVEIVTTNAQQFFRLKLQ